jgi:renalase
MQTRVAIIGAGLAGLAAARPLVDAGYDVVVFEKSRGLGGRIATRRTDLGPIDHGAPGVPSDLALAWGGAFWLDGKDNARGVGVPGMSALARAMATGIDVRTGVTVVALGERPDGWQLTDSEGGDRGTFDATVLAVPAPQAGILLAQSPDMVAELAPVEMLPMWTLLLGFDVPTGLPQGVQDFNGPLMTAIPMLAKPGQSGAERWTVYAQPDWSAQFVDIDKAEAAATLLAAFRTATQLAADPAYIAVHRWRYARVGQALGRPFVANRDETLLAGGDWTLGSFASDAVASGEAMATRLLKRRSAADWRV